VRSQLLSSARRTAQDRRRRPHRPNYPRARSSSNCHLPLAVDHFPLSSPIPTAKHVGSQCSTPRQPSLGSPLPDACSLRLVPHEQARSGSRGHRAVLRFGALRRPPRHRAGKGGALRGGGHDRSPRVANVRRLVRPGRRLGRFPLIHAEALRPSRLGVELRRRRLDADQESLAAGSPLRARRLPWRYYPGQRLALPVAACRRGPGTLPCHRCCAGSPNRRAGDPSRR
jgi:hypothetical protein